MNFSKNGIFSLLLSLVSILSLISCGQKSSDPRVVIDFNDNWKFHLGDVADGQDPQLDHSAWRTLDLPHDWSIEGEFDEDNPAGAGGGALPGGIGWYRKEFFVSKNDSSKHFFVEFDGIYQNSEVWINDHYLGKRPFGYISFDYELTEYLNFGKTPNIVAVRVDNSKQPNSRWYSGSGIYRNVRLVSVNPLHVQKWGAFIKTVNVMDDNAEINIELNYINKLNIPIEFDLITTIKNDKGQNILSKSRTHIINADTDTILSENYLINEPDLWSPMKPNFYEAAFAALHKDKVYDQYSAKFGIRTFSFDPDSGFILNGKRTKIRGVCQHHDLGALGAAVNKRAIQRQLEILKDMGVNGIRTAHNPPAPELLELCDEMGFIVMDEAFDIWKLKKSEYDYSLIWDEWHERDLRDFILRDRNHPSVFIWSIGNEVIEQWDQDDTTGKAITKNLASIVKSVDKTRPVTAACNGTDPANPLFRSDALDLIGFNYHHEEYKDFPDKFPGQSFIATETESSLHTRGSYDMPSDSIRRWPIRWDIPFTTGNPDLTCSSYDNCSAPWGSTHRETWELVKNLDYVSGMFTWTGFDYLGEPTPYSWPAKSSYFGLIDLAGFPKDAYYFYQSEWTDKDVLHIFPHWNWTEGQDIDVWAYTNCTEVELFLNDESVGIKRKTENDYYLVWNLKFTKGEIKAVGKTIDNRIITNEIRTASDAYKIELLPDRIFIDADGKDLSFVTVRILDETGNLVPKADNLVTFSIEGNGKIIGVDNGLQTSLESFKGNSRRAFNGLCLAIIQSNKDIGKIELTAKSEGLIKSSVEIFTK